MKKKLFGFVTIILLSLGLAACGDDKKNDATGNVVEVNLKASNFAFDQEEIHAKAGDTIKFTLTNEEGAHSINIDGYGTVNDGQTLEFVVKEPGEINFYCNVVCGTGHGDMKGKIIVD